MDSDEDDLDYVLEDGPWNNKGLSSLFKGGAHVLILVILGWINELFGSDFLPFAFVGEVFLLSWLRS